MEHKNLESDDTFQINKKKNLNLLGPPSYNDIYGKLCIKTPPPLFPSISPQIYNVENGEKVIEVDPSGLGSTTTFKTNKSTTKQTVSNTLSQLTLPEAHYPQRQPIKMSASNASGMNTTMSYDGRLGPTASTMNQPPPPYYPEVTMPPVS